MPEVELVPAEDALGPTANNPGDALFFNTFTAVGAEDTDLRFGRDNAKTPVNRGAIQHYDTSSIPLSGSLNVEDVLIEMMPTADGLTGFTGLVDVLTLDTRLDAVDSRVIPMGFDFTPSWTVFPATSIWANQVITPDTIIQRDVDVRYGLGNVCQAWRSNYTGDLRAYWWNGFWRTGTTGASIAPRLWSATGGAGANVKDQDLHVGSLVNADATVTTTAGGLTILLTSGGTTGPYPQVQNGTIYIAEVGIVGGTGANAFRWDIDSTPPIYPPSSPVDNISIYGATREQTGVDRKLQGFGGKVQWFSGQDISGHAVIGSTDTLNPFPNFSNGVLYKFDGGGGVYTGTSTLPNIRNNIELALRARTSLDQFIAIRFQDFAGTTNNRERQYRASGHASATRGSLFGMILTIQYTGLPGTRQVRRMGRNVARRRRRRC